jgi:NDP-sugar pyrophosphorylase family protein
MHSAFILAAGFGTRLRPLTALRPKPLVPVCGIPMLEYVFSMCRRYGLKRVIVNAHFLSEQITAYAGDRDGLFVTVSVEQPEILGTGGGLKRVCEQLGSRIVVLNGDVLCDVDLHELLERVPPGGAAMALRAHPEDALNRYGIVATDSEDRIVDLKTMAMTAPIGPVRRDSHFTGIHALDREVLDRVPEGFGCIVRTAYLELVPERKLVGTHHTGVWLDVGDPLAYLETNLSVLRQEIQLDLDPFAHASCWVSKQGRGGEAPDVNVSGSVWVGDGVEFAPDVCLEDTVVGSHVTILSGTKLKECVVWDGAKVPAGVWSRRIFYGSDSLQIT